VEQLEQADLYELERARVIGEIAMTSHQWLDVHSTSSPGCAYALPTANASSEALAERLDIGTVS